jgi:hypothetical protein
MRASHAAVTMTIGAVSCVLAAGCGDSGSTTATPATAASPSTTATTDRTQVGGKFGFTGQSICDAVPPSQVVSVLLGPAKAAKPSEPKKGIHACSWVGQDGKRALVAVIFDDSFDKKFVDSPLDLTNEAAGTSFSTAVNTGNDVGARSVTAYGLNDGSPYVATSGLARVANTLNDFIVDQDQAQRD